jgi:hypothetical protein
MNSSLITADSATHLKVVILGLLAAILVVWIGIAARNTSERTSSAVPRIEMPMPKPSPAVRPPSGGKAAVA